MRMSCSIDVSLVWREDVISKHPGSPLLEPGLVRHNYKFVWAEKAVQWCIDRALRIEHDFEVPETYARILFKREEDALAFMLAHEGTFIVDEKEHPWMKMMSVTLNSEYMESMRVLCLQLPRTA